MECCCRIRRTHAGLDAITPPVPIVEKVAGAFGFTEGPVWVRDGFLLFSDIPNNVIFKWQPGAGIFEFLKPSGYNGSDADPGSHCGSNGLTLDHQARLIICEHRRLTRLEIDGSRTVLADNYLGKRLNSPNDVVCKSDGTIYFTDPPYGLPKRDMDPQKELSFNGLYRLSQGRLQLLDESMSRPNGLAFSPDETYLFVSNSDPSRKIWMRFAVSADGTLSRGEVFYDATQTPTRGLPDGLKIDRLGNLYCTGPGGIWVFSPEGEHLGMIEIPEVPANCAWGDEEGKTLYITARTGLYRINLNIEGIRP
jgi:gluconolactonase